MIQAGVVGLNIEDAGHATKELFSAEVQAEKIRAIRKVGESKGVHLVINARTDSLRIGKGNDDEKMEDAIQRCTIYRDAGADCLYPMGLTTHDQITEFMRSFDGFPVNVMVRKGIPNLKELESLGIKRVSFGPAPNYAVMGFLKKISDQVIREGSFSMLIDGAISYDELNALAIPKTFFKP